MIAEAARFGDEEQRDHVAWGWLAEREPADAAREIPTAAEGMSPLLRSVAVGVVERLGEAALPAWRDIAATPCVGPHARAVLAGWDQGSEPGDADWEWLGVEAAAARDDDQDYPVCVEYPRRLPGEYWSEDDPVEPEPFGLKEVNRRLAALRPGDGVRGTTGHESG